MEQDKKGRKTMNKAMLRQEDREQGYSKAKKKNDQEELS